MAYQTQHYQAGLRAGREISPAPSQGGSKLILPEASLVGPNAVPELGDPVYVGQISGIVVQPPSASGQRCIVQTTGVWSMTVLAQDGEGNENIALGASLFLGSDGVISLDDTGVLFGYALNEKTGSATPSTICLKLKG